MKIKTSREKVIPKVFGLIALFTSVTMSATKSIITETASLAARLLHHEERAKSSPENTPNFTNPLESIVEAGNDTSPLKEPTVQPDRLGFVNAMRKEIGAHEIDKHWNLVRIRELNGKKNIMSIWSFKRKIDSYGRLIKQKARLCTHGGMQQWRINYWETYYPVVNWMFVRAMLTLLILRELHTKSVDSVLTYDQDDVKSYIFMELPIGFGV